VHVNKTYDDRRDYNVRHKRIELAKNINNNNNNNKTYSARLTNNVQARITKFKIIDRQACKTSTLNLSIIIVHYFTV